MPCAKTYGFVYDDPRLGHEVYVLGFDSAEDRDEALIHWARRQFDDHMAYSAVRVEATLH